jgi:hypothetical protein
METERIALNRKERDWLRVLHEVQRKQLTQIEAASRMKISDSPTPGSFSRWIRCRLGPLAHSFFHECVRLLPLFGSEWVIGVGPTQTIFGFFGCSPTPLLSVLLGALFFALLLGLPSILFLGHG